MKTAAMTRIWKNQTILELWLSYYSRYFDDLFVFSGRYQGKDQGDFSNLQEKYKFEVIKVEDDFYSEGCHDKVFAKQKELLLNHRWVLYSDADEIVVADPEKYEGLRHYMSLCQDDQTFCKGYEVYQSEGELPLDYTKPILQQRKMWCKDTTKSYDKPCLSCIASDWGLGFHYIKGMADSIDKLPFMGLYLLHMKYADPSALFDFPRENTGTSQNDGYFKTEGVPIPEKVRRVF